MDTGNSNRKPQQQAQQPGSSTPSSQQQDQYAPTTGQQGGSVAKRRGGAALPSLWSGRGPLELVRQLDEDMDRLFHRLWGGGRGDVQQMWAPQLEVFERDGKLHVHADLPGMKKEDVQLSVENDQLVIHGERRSEHEDKGEQPGGYWHSERSYGSFYRSVPLPEGVDASTAKASFKGGVLEVTFDAPKVQKQQGRKIDIGD